MLLTVAPCSRLDQKSNSANTVPPGRPLIFDGFRHTRTLTADSHQTWREVKKVKVKMEGNVNVTTKNVFSNRSRGAGTHIKYEDTGKDEHKDANEDQDEDNEYGRCKMDHGRCKYSHFQQLHTLLDRNRP